MATAQIDGLSIAYELLGDSGQAWVITPGGRFSKDDPGIRELATALAADGNRALIWDRPNTGESDVTFEGSSESAMQADVLAGLLRHLDLAPAVIMGGSGGSRVSLLTAARHRDVAAGLAVLWISGGPLSLLSIGMGYVGDSIRAAFNSGMEAVLEVPEWEEVLRRNPSNRQRFLEQDPVQFKATLEKWLVAYCPCGDDLVPGLPNADARALDVPAIVFRSGTTDLSHPRFMSEEVAATLPNARLVEPPWGDNEWNQQGAANARTYPGKKGAGSVEKVIDGVGLFNRWPLLAPQLLEWQREVLG